MSGSRAVLLLLLSIVGSIVSTGLSPLTRVALPDFALIVALYAGLTSRHSGGGLAAQLLVGGRAAQGAVAGLALLLLRMMLTVIVLISDGNRDLAWSGLRSLPMQLVLTAGVAPLTISVLSRIDARFGSKVARPGLWS